ncbi:MAG TPA: NAD(P)H-hydrate dehydratase, partial [Actinomycetota bacterium]
ASEGVSVCCYSVVDPSSLMGAAKHHFDLYRQLGGRTVVRDPRPLFGCDLAIDAIFGTGFRADDKVLPAEVAEAIDVMNSTAPRVIAIDVPSGVDGTTGAVATPAVRAHTTIVMAAEKIGTALPPGALHAGVVRVVDIGIDVNRAGHAFVLPAPSDVPRRDPSLHKRSAGSVAILAGSDAMQGAALLTVRGAQRIGAGYVTLGTTANVKANAHRSTPEALVLSAADGDALAAGALDATKDVVERADALALGPGMGQGDGQRALVERALAEVDKPLVLDADALNVLARDPSPLIARAEKGWGEVVLTPHPAELARLLGIATEEVQRDRAGVAATAAERFGATVVLKGWRSIVASRGRVAICPTGGPELATAGTGDVLTGAIAGLGGGVKGAEGGVYVHGLAGTVAGERSGPAGVVAWDVAEALPGAWARISAGEDHDWLG